MCVENDWVVFVICNCVEHSYVLDHKVSYNSRTQENEPMNEKFAQIRTWTGSVKSTLLETKRKEGKFKQICKVTFNWLTHWMARSTGFFVLCNLRRVAKKKTALAFLLDFFFILWSDRSGFDLQLHTEDNGCLDRPVNPFMVDKRSAGCLLKALYCWRWSSIFSLLFLLRGQLFEMKRFWWICLVIKHAFLASKEEYHNETKNKLKTLHAPRNLNSILNFNQKLGILVCLVLAAHLLNQFFNFCFFRFLFGLRVR